jgi:2-polyprenyl-3-methyl-5-hydroxy-6-metoxy-1,4-benzoquinol methylase
MDKIKLNLFDLKSKKDLLAVYKYFKSSTKKWFAGKEFQKSEIFMDRNCPLCGESSSRFVFEIDSFNYEECVNCCSIYTKPFPKPEVLGDLYSDGDYQVYQQKFVEKGQGIRQGLLEKRKFAQVKKFAGMERIQLLDVGSGKATFLNVCKNEGWIVEGIETTKSAKSDAWSKYGIVVHEESFEEIEIKKSFDVITFWGVLEHLQDPVMAITKAKSMLRDSGLLVFEVPSADCFLRHYLEKYPFGATRYIESGRHNIFFSKKIIEILAEKLGFKSEYIETNGLDIQTILLEELDHELTDKILNMQDIANNLLLGDHYRVFLRKN